MRQFKDENRLEMFPEVTNGRRFTPRSREEAAVLIAQGNIRKTIEEFNHVAERSARVLTARSGRAE